MPEIIPFIVHFHTRSYKPELLDRPDIPPDDIRRNMQELDFINTWLGGHAITLRGLKALAGDRKKLRVCEIGCGGGDNLEAIRRYCAQHGIAASFTGIDVNPFCINVARQRWGNEGATFIVSDYRDVHFDEQPDIIFSSLFCHHFTDDEMVKQLQWMQRHAQLGFFINDLHRHPLAYHSINWLTAMFSRSYLVKHDAPLSVLRAFTRAEWIKLLNTAEIVNFSVSWRWAFRWLVVSKNY